MNDTQSLKDKLAWTEFNLAGANAEVRKGVRVIAKLEMALHDIRRVAYDHAEAFRLADDAINELEEFKSSYID